MSASAATSVDSAEVARFNALAAQWWDPKGPSRALFALNPARLGFVRKQLVSHFSLIEAARTPLNGLRLLDLGCGGGLVSEPLARLGATVTAIDAAEDNIAIARAHAAGQRLSIDYQATSAEALVATEVTFDAVISLEVLEHVADVPGFLASCHQLVRPGGLFIFSTLNRTPQSFATAIIGAEYVARLLPRGTHSWRKFITPEEMREMLHITGFDTVALKGLSYHLATDNWSLTDRLAINYIGVAHRPEAQPA